MTKPAQVAEEAVAIEQLAAQRRARLRTGRVEVPDPYAPPPRHRPEQKPVTLKDMIITVDEGPSATETAIRWRRPEASWSFMTLPQTTLATIRQARLLGLAADS